MISGSAILANDSVVGPLPESGARGELYLRFKRDNVKGHTILATSTQHHPMKVVRAFTLADGASLVHLHNLSGGVLGGDRLHVVVDVENGASVQLTSTGATRIYRSRNGIEFAELENIVNIADNALLEYIPDPLIPYAGSRSKQTTEIKLGNDAGLLWWEILAPGREAYGELFDFDELHLELRISANGRPIAIDRSRLVPRRWPIDSPARLSAFRYLANFYICRQGINETRWRELESLLTTKCGLLSNTGESSWGATMLKSDGVIVRAMSKSGRDLLPGLKAIWTLAKRELYGRDAIPPRKVI